MKIGCDFISSEIKSNKEKIEKVNKFRHGEFEIMFATDIMARGIDIRTVGLVVNYGVPLYKKEGAINFHTYIHRIARTGRFIDLGVSLTFLKQKQPHQAESDDVLIHKVDKYFKESKNDQEK